MNEGSLITDLCSFTIALPTVKLLSSGDQAVNQLNRQYPRRTHWLKKKLLFDGHALLNSSYTFLIDKGLQNWAHGFEGKKSWAFLFPPNIKFSWCLKRSMISYQTSYFNFDIATSTFCFLVCLIVWSHGGKDKIFKIDKFLVINI